MSAILRFPLRLFDEYTKRRGTTSRHRSHPIKLISAVGTALVSLLVLEQGSTVRTAMGQEPSAPEPVPAEIFKKEGAERLSVPTFSPQIEEISPQIEEIGGRWRAQGPSPTEDGQVQNVAPNDAVSGAIHAVVADPNNSDILYIGAVNGGVWRTRNATAASPTWTPLTDFERSLSIGALAMDPGNARVLVAGIGRFSSFGGDPPFRVAGGLLSGLLRTTNGGRTWIQITDPLLVNQHISSVASRGRILLAGANDFFGGSGGGLFRSTNRGGGHGPRSVARAPACRRARLTIWRVTRPIEGASTSRSRAMGFTALSTQARPGSRSQTPMSR